MGGCGVMGMYLHRNQIPELGQFLSSWKDFWDSLKGKNTGCSLLNSPSFGERDILPLSTWPCRDASPGAQVPLTQKWVYNVGRPIRTPCPSRTVTGPEGTCNPSRATAFSEQWKPRESLFLLNLKLH